MPLCLSAGLLSTTLAANAFTLAWTHSIEKVRWEEDWRIAGTASKSPPPASAAPAPAWSRRRERCCGKASGTTRHRFHHSNDYA
jgi:hypothetical protein